MKLGTGSRWLDAYSKLDSLGLTVLGGGVLIIGVGGFLLDSESPIELGVA